MILLINSLSNRLKNKKHFFGDCRFKNKIFVLIRNKYDITKEEISDEEAIEFEDSNNMLFFHLSLHEKNETGIKELFEKEKRKINAVIFLLFFIYF